MSRDEAAALLALPDVSAVVAREAARVLVGDSDSWEPESLWLSLERAGATLAPGVQDKLSAARTAAVSAAFCFDAIVFLRTVAAFAGHGTDPDVLEEPDVADACRTVEQVARIRQAAGHGPLEWDSGPRAVAAVLLHRAGMVLPPHQLAFEDDAAAHLPVDRALRDEVRARWREMADAADLAHRDFPETPVGVQLARLAAVELRVRELRAAETSQLARLGQLALGSDGPSAAD